eukprot:m.85958 g.85958  ORF g.85958 m.85958 type:complete len:388 (-) comp14443_c2_seq2:51-1214(-)
MASIDKLPVPLCELLLRRQWIFSWRQRLMQRRTTYVVYQRISCWVTCRQLVPAILISLLIVSCCPRPLLSVPQISWAMTISLPPTPQTTPLKVQPHHGPITRRLHTLPHRPTSKVGKHPFRVSLPQITALMAPCLQVSVPAVLALVHSHHRITQQRPRHASWVASALLPRAMALSHRHICPPRHALRPLTRECIVPLHLAILQPRVNLRPPLITRPHRQGTHPLRQATHPRLQATRPLHPVIRPHLHPIHPRRHTIRPHPPAIRQHRRRSRPRRHPIHPLPQRCRQPLLPILQLLPRILPRLHHTPRHRHRTPQHRHLILPPHPRTLPPHLLIPRHRLPTLPHLHTTAQATHATKTSTAKSGLCFCFCWLGRSLVLKATLPSLFVVP